VSKTKVPGYKRTSERATITYFDHVEGTDESYRVIKTDGRYVIEMRQPDDRWEVVDFGNCLRSEDAGFILKQYLDR
jgi:hypothetical protein